MADPSYVDTALMMVLANDAALMALCPHGVWWGAPPQGATKSVIVALLDHSDRPALDSKTLYERSVYLVKAVLLMVDGATPQGAAARIHELLHNAVLDLSGSGYEEMSLRRIERLRLPPEVDPLNKARWQHEGGQYELMAYPT
jgi:hypothetical protein